MGAERLSERGDNDETRAPINFDQIGQSRTIVRVCACVCAHVRARRSEPTEEDLNPQGCRIHSARTHGRGRCLGGRTVRGLYESPLMANGRCEYVR